METGQNKRKTLAVIGSTGSVGTQGLDVAARAGLEVVSLAAGQNFRLLEGQCRRFLPKIAALADESAAAELKIRLADTNIKVLSGPEGVMEAAAAGADIALCAIVGTEGLMPALSAIGAGSELALANKESLVCAGGIVTARAKEAGVRIVPVDSEHSAIYRCIYANQGHKNPKRLILTASGGPFRGFAREELLNVTPKMALAHPNWSMGKKITVDSATMMNKGLELIEAVWLFSVPEDRIDILIHPGSIVHSLAVFEDGAALAQLGTPDMRTPISFALTGDAGTDCGAAPLDLAALGPLEFSRPDGEAFPAPELARAAIRLGDGACAVLNGANEAAVELFLAGKIGFLEIAELVQRALSDIKAGPVKSPEDALELDRAARERVLSLI